MPHLRLFVFGPPRLERAGQPIDLGLRKAMTLLVYLGVSAQPHSREALATMFWPENDRREGRSRLRHALHRLNQALGTGILTADSERVELQPAIDLWLDSAAFAEGVTATLPPDPAEPPVDAERLARLEAAVALYSDDFLAGFALPDAPAFDEWQFFQGERLRQLLMQALPVLVQTYARRGAGDVALRHARRWLALDPLHEPAHRALMRLYADTGQQAAALRQYQECARRLEAELGIAPEAATSDLYEQIRTRRLLVAAPARPQRADGGAPADEPAEAEPMRPGARADGEPLPAPLTSFIGRETEIAALQTFLTHPGVRLVTLTGPGGVGKTRLALQVAREVESRFRDGVVFVPLAPITDPELVLPTLARNLGVIEGGDQALMVRVLAHLRRRQMLIVLDNMEHVAAAAPHLAALLSGAQSLTLLATSRVALRVSGEQEYPVVPLVAPELTRATSLEQLLRFESVQLFVERMNAIRPDLTLTSENVIAIAEICRRLDGLPLALELAAARIRVLTPQLLLGRLERRLPLLTNQARDVPARHKTLSATIAWSYDLLDAAEQRLFRRLAVFVGGCTLDAVEFVCADVAGGLDDRPMLDVLESLIDKSLVQQHEQQGEPRYTMLETIREYASARLAESGEEATIQQRHTSFFVDLADRADAGLRSAAQRAWFARIAAEHNNLRTVLGRARAANIAPTVLQIGGALWRFWSVYGYYAEGRRWLMWALNEDQGAPAPAAPEVRMRALNCAGYLAWNQGDRAVARAMHSEALEIARQVGNQRYLAMALRGLGTVHVFESDYSTTYRCLHESMTLIRGVGDTWDEAAGLLVFGFAAAVCGDQATAHPLLQQSLALFRSIDDTWGVSTALMLLGFSAYEQGDLTLARTCLTESVALQYASGLKMFFATTLDALAGVAARQGQGRTAVQLLGAADALHATIGTSPGRLGQAHYQRYLATARAQLAPETFAEAWQTGRSLPEDQVAALAAEGA